MEGWFIKDHSIVYFCPLFSVPNATRYFGSWVCYHLHVKVRKTTTVLIKKERAIPISNPCIIVSVPDIRSLWILYPALKEAVEQRTHRHVDYGMCSWRNRILGTYLTYLSFLSVKLGVSCQGQNINWGYLKKRCLGMYLVLCRRKWQENGENCIMRSFVVCISQ
jgi:hypothetical protein